MFSVCVLYIRVGKLERLYVSFSAVRLTGCSDWFRALSFGYHREHAYLLLQDKKGTHERKRVMSRSFGLGLRH